MFRKALLLRLALSAVFFAALLAPRPAFAQVMTDAEKVLGVWKLTDIQDDTGDRSSDLDIYAFGLTFHAEENDVRKVDVEIVTGGGNGQTLGPYDSRYIIDEAKDSLTVTISVTTILGTTDLVLPGAYVFDGDDAMSLRLDSEEINDIIILLPLLAPGLAPVTPYAGVLLYIFTALDKITSAEGATELPETASLAQNYPNPFNPSTEITWRLEESGPVRLDVFDMAGKRVATLADGMYPQGEHSVRFDAAGLPTGTYAYRLTLGNDARTLTRLMTLVR